MSIASLRVNWLGNVRADVLAGLVVALALIPEAISFSILAGVDPKVGLYAAFSMAVVIAFAGGRPAMISAATGAMSMLMIGLIKDHGLQYLFAATILCGLFQVLIGLFKLGMLMRFVSRSVVAGFLNALAIVIFTAQLPELIGVTWVTYPMIALGLAIIILFPRLTTAIPSPLICIAVLTAIALGLGLELRTVGDKGELPSAFPVFALPRVPLTLDTLLIILPYSATLSVVGLLESMMTATVVDDLTHTSSDKNRECVGQGIANLVTGCLGGMAGCAMIGQSIINVRSGGRKRLSTLVAGLGLLIAVVVLGDWAGRIPMAALVAIMLMVCVGTFNWDSVRNLRRNPKSSSLVMLATVVVVLATNDLAKGVIVGVLLSGINFAWKVTRLFKVTSSLSADATARTYTVHGQVFFASAEAFASAFDFDESVATVEIDLRHAHFWDISAVAALDKVVMKYRRQGILVEITGMNEASATMIGQHATHDQAALNQPEVLDGVPAH
jgi:SulP family sulfate permease